jgi:hypothetical protein
MAPLLAIAGEKPDKAEICTDLIKKTTPSYYNYQVSQCVTSKTGACTYEDDKNSCGAREIISCLKASLKSQMSMIKKLKKYQCLESLLADTLEAPADPPVDNEL